jgi:hypothetical protein
VILMLSMAVIGLLALVFGEKGFSRFEHWWFESKKPRAERLPYTWGCPDCRWSNPPHRGSDTDR